MQRRLAAKRDLRLPQELAKRNRYACLILEDIIDRVVHHGVSVDMMAIDRYRAKEAPITSQQAATILPDAEAPSSTDKQEISPVTSENGTR